MIELIKDNMSGETVEDDTSKYCMHISSETRSETNCSDDVLALGID